MFGDLLLARAAALTPLSPDQIVSLARHYELMLRWNKVLNLTRITEAAEAIERHYIESLFLGIHLPLGALCIADVGAGGGFPGIPLAVLRPDCDVTLIECHQRKAVFLREATRELSNVRVTSRRAEELEGRFDWVTSRAVSYEDLREPLRRLADRALLLGGQEAPPEDWRWTWDTVAVPGRQGSYLRIGTKSFT